MEVSGENLMSTAKPYFTGYTGFAFQAYPNREFLSKILFVILKNSQAIPLHIANAMPSLRLGT